MLEMPVKSEGALTSAVVLVDLVTIAHGSASVQVGSASTKRQGCVSLAVQGQAGTTARIRRSKNVLVTVFVPMRPVTAHLAFLGLTVACQCAQMPAVGMAGVLRKLMAIGQYVSASRASMVLHAT